MSKVYIPKDTYAVCTYQQNSDPKKIYCYSSKSFRKQK